MANTHKLIHTFGKSMWLVTYLRTGFDKYVVVDSRPVRIPNKTGEANDD